MARTSRKSFVAEDDEDDEPTDLLPVKRAPTANGSTPTVSEEVQKESDAYEDLVARTRKSMAGYEAAKQKAQFERRRSLRKSKAAPRREGSYFPSVEEETLHIDASVLAEELGEEDYEAVFMSRPRIKMSPAPTPTKTWTLDEAE
jgi:hypothetical protein